MNQGGFITQEAMEEIKKKLKEKSSWYLLNGKIIHCASYELSIYKEIMERKEES